MSKLSITCGVLAATGVFVLLTPELREKYEIEKSISFKNLKSTSYY